MVALTRPQRLILPLPVAGAAVGGGVTALAFLLMPARLLEGAVVASGIPAVLAAAEPPLGFTARIALAIVFGGLVAAFAWFGLKLVAGDRPFAMPDLASMLRRDPAAADAPPRPPLFAHRDLGTPFLEVKAPMEAMPAPPPAERDLPADLDQPLAAFDPGAIPAAPLPPPEPVAPLARPQLIDPADRFETFELTPVQRERASPPPPEPRPMPLSLRMAPVSPPEPAAPLTVAPETESTVHALLARLERGVTARTVAPPEPVEPARAHSLQDTLSDLRRLATGAH